MHPKVAMFLTERDRAYARRDTGIIRSMNAELRRLGVRDDATMAHPTGAPKRRKVREVTEVHPEVPLEIKNPGRPKLPRCEHENVADRCPECNPELVAH